jgi:hypothetical protein
MQQTLMVKQMMLTLRIMRSSLVIGGIFVLMAGS